MPKPELRPPAGHKSADVRVVAPINAGQQGDTTSIWGTVVLLFAVLSALVAMVLVAAVVLGQAMVVFAQLLGVIAARVLL